MSAEIAAQFRTLIGPEHVIAEAAEREYYSSDISGPGDAIAALVTAEATEGDVILVMGPESVTPLADRISSWVEARAAA